MERTRGIFERVILAKSSLRPCMSAAAQRSPIVVSVTWPCVVVIMPSFLAASTSGNRSSTS